MISYKIDPVYYGDDILDDWEKLETYLNENCNSNKRLVSIIATGKTTSSEARYLIIWEITE